MRIALDYDQTYTADPDGWDAVIAHLKARGHEFVCVTGRTSPPDPARERQIPMPVICAGDPLKSRAAAAAGLVVDVWIDDCPGTIEHQRVAEFGEPEQTTALAKPDNWLQLAPHEQLDWLKQLRTDLSSREKTAESRRKASLIRVFSRTSNQSLASCIGSGPGKPGQFADRAFCFSARVACWFGRWCRACLREAKDRQRAIFRRFALENRVLVLRIEPPAASRPSASPALSLRPPGAFSSARSFRGRKLSGSALAAGSAIHRRLALPGHRVADTVPTSS